MEDQEHNGYVNGNNNNNNNENWAGWLLVIAEERQVLHARGGGQRGGAGGFQQIPSVSLAATVGATGGTFLSSCIVCHYPAVNNKVDIMAALC